MNTLPTRLLAALALLAGLACAAGVRAADAPLPPDSVYHLEATLTDQDGAPVKWRDLRGRPRLVSMFYTSCQYICPLIVEGAKAVERPLAPAERARLGVVLVSMDPARDTPAALAKVVAERRIDGDRWTLASPPPSQVRAIAGVLGIRYRQLADGEFNHTSELVLVDAEGRILARTTRIGSNPDPEFLAAVRAAM
jgi:protein SCO1/2